MTTCKLTGKRVLTQREALAEARWWRRSMFARMARCRCRSCGGWHVGNATRKPRTRRAA